MLIVLMALMALPAAGSTAAAATPSGFSVVTVPGVSGVVNLRLTGVTAPSHTDAWISGYQSADAYDYQPVLEQWSGASWSAQSVPLPTGSTLAGLEAVASSSTSNVWVAGFYSKKARPQPGLGWRALLERRTKSGWRRVAVTIPGHVIHDIWSLSVQSTTSVWALVSMDDCDEVEVHWDGSSWQVVNDQEQCDAGSDVTLATVSSTGPASTWVVGSAIIDYDTNAGYLACSGSGCPASQLPDDGYQITSAAGSPSSTWVIGSTDEAGTQPLAYHWNGSTWSDLSPTFGYTTYHELEAATVLPSGNVWAVGTRASATPGAAGRTLILEHTASGWHDLGGPNVGTDQNGLGAIVHATGTASEMWAIGDAGSGGPIVLHHP